MALAALLSAGMAFLLVPPSSALAAAVAGVVAGLLFGGFLAWRLPIQRVQRAQEAGELPDDDVRMAFDAAGVEVERSGWRSHVLWSAIERIAAARHQIFVHLSDIQAFTVPRRAIGDRAAQAAFVAQLREWAAHGVESALPQDPDPGRDHRVLRYRLVVDDYVLFSRVVHADQLRRRPLGLALMGVLVAGVLLVSAEPWRGGLDPGLMGLMVLFSGTLVLLGLAPLWYPRMFTPWIVRRSLQRSPGRMPSGPVVLGVGPDGGWMRSARGVSRFSWHELRRVHSDADLVLMLFSDLVGVIVPSRAFERATDQDAFVADIEAWQAQAGPPVAPARVARSARARPSVRDPANPFDPPEGA